MTGVCSRVCSRLGFERLAHDDRHRTGALQLLGGDGFAGLVVADHDPPEAGTQVGGRGGERQDGHDLGGSRDVEARLTRDAIGLAAETDDDVAQCTVVDIEHPPPRDVVHVEVELVALVQMVVDHGRQQVVRRRHGVEVAGEVQVQQLHRDHLAVATAGCPALDAERRAHRRLTQADGGALADVLHRHAETDRRRGLALAERRRGDRGHDHVLGLRAVGQLGDGLQPDLGQVVAVRLRADVARCPSQRRFR